MSLQKIAALIVIFVGASIAWMILGSANLIRTDESSSSLKSTMHDMYGDELTIAAPTLFKRMPKLDGDVILKNNNDDEDDEDVETVINTNNLLEEYSDLKTSDIKIDVKLDRRKKGYLWFPTFKAHFSAKYTFIIENFNQNHSYYVSTIFSSSDNIYNNVKVRVNGEEVKDFLKLLVNRELTVFPKRNGELEFEVEYDATGMELLQYTLASRNELTQVNGFNCVITTDFKDYDFPRTMFSPTTKEETKEGAKLTWNFTNTITGKNIGLIIPNKLTPGYITSRVAFFAPIPLLFFFIVLLMISTVTKQDIHAMHFFFLALSFFSFHLMFSYFSDQMNIYLSFAISSFVSLMLTVTYVMHFLSKKMSFIIIPLIQIVYLFVFSFSFFFDGITGLIVTICAVTTLFVLMQLTAKKNWHEVFNPSKKDEGK